LCLAILATPPNGPERRLHAAAAPHAAKTARASRLAYPPTFSRYQEGEDLRAFVERATARVHDPQAMYYVSQALEECRTWGATPDDEEPPSSVMVVSYVDSRQWVRLAAAESLAAPCRGFEGSVIDSRQILALLLEAARLGEPHARARMLLFRDIAEPKSDVIPEIPTLLATADPQIVRDVGAFLARGEVSLRYGGEIVDASTAAIAWELAACDLGYPCGPLSRLVLSRCAFRGYCDAYNYDEAIARDEDPGRMAQAQRLREGMVYALRRQDWRWLGLT
jgi:hypothetical protein